MSLFDEPKSVMKHMNDLDQNHGGARYAHERAAATGWRAERRLAEARADDTTEQEPTSVSGALGWLRAGLSILGVRYRAS